MSERDLRQELLAEVKPLIDRIFTAVKGANAGACAYALLSAAVTAWRKTGLSDSKLHETLDGLLDGANEIEAAHAAGKN